MEAGWSVWQITCQLGRSDCVVTRCWDQRIGAIFQQDNARSNTVRVSQDYHCTVTILPWPSRSPDLSPIEHIWDHLERRVGQPMTLNELETSDEAHFWLNGYFNKQSCRIWSEANPQVHVKTPLHPEKLTVWCALWVGGILFGRR
ncbi:transposable element Tcb2 transposase [Trichonephila clavipes]|nr:transposable element Tcb2 transposase [Trichonephila clavipes]